MPDKSYTGFGYAKALIFGEYAVLHGAPGLVAALSPRLYLTLSNLQMISDKMPDTSLERFEDFNRQLQAFLQYFLHAHADLTLDMTEFFDANGQKIGIGSSAAAMVALADAWTQAQGTKLNIDLPTQLHRALQHGMGSGIDIIASTYGGIQLVRHCPENPQITSVPVHHLPKMMFLASHIEAPTRQFIAASKAVEHQKNYKNIIAALTEIYEILANLALDGKKRDFLEQIDHLPALLHRLGHVIEMPIIPKIFNELRPIARECRVVLKTSGAGGGDIFLALAENDEDLQNFAKRIPDTSGVTTLNVHIASQRWNL